jgi:hypothetical protein
MSATFSFLAKASPQKLGEAKTMTRALLLVALFVIGNLATLVIVGKLTKRQFQQTRLRAQGDPARIESARSLLVRRALFVFLALLAVNALLTGVVFLLP